MLSGSSGPHRASFCVSRSSPAPPRWPANVANGDTDRIHGRGLGSLHARALLGAAYRHVRWVPARVHGWERAVAADRDRVDPSDGARHPPRGVRPGIPEAVHLRFALSAIRQGQPIGPAATVDFIEPLLAVWDLGALLVDGGILLTWRSNSLRAEQVEIVRVHLEAADGGTPDPGFPVVQQASSTSYLDVARSGRCRRARTISTA